MKKLNIFVYFLIIIFSTFFVVSCGSALSKTQTFSDKIISLKKLSTNDLISNNVKVHSDMRPDDIENIAKIIGADKWEDGSIAKDIIYSNTRSYLMANELLFNISRNVPGYEWIYSQIRWQSSYLSFQQIFQNSANNDLNYSKIISSWLPSINNWSLSVTFLDAEKNAWMGLEEPRYARININQKIDVDSNGNIDLKNSNQNAIWRTEIQEENGRLPNPSQSFSSKKTDEKYDAAIYQGFVNSSSLLDLQNVYTTEIYKPTIDSLFFTPTVVDFINNTLLNLDIINEAIKFYKDELDNYIRRSILADPFYLGEGVERNSLKNRISNIIGIKITLQLFNMHNNSGTEINNYLKFALIKLNDEWRSYISMLDGLEQNSDDKKAIDNFEKIYATLSDKEENQAIITSEDEKNFEAAAKNIIKISTRDTSINNSYYTKTEEPVLSEKLLKVSGYMEKNKKFENIFGNGLQKKFSKFQKEELEEYGLNDKYNFLIQYYSKEPWDELDQEDESWDDSKGLDQEHWSILKFDDDNDRNKVSDKGFKNISWKPRMQSMLSKFLVKKNTPPPPTDPNDPNPPSTWIEKENWDSIAPLSTFDFDKIKCLTEEELKDADYKWFKDKDFLKSLNPNIKSYDEIRIMHYVDWVRNSLNYTIRKYFTMEKHSNKYESDMQKLGFSSDLDITGVKNLETASTNDNDDDIAFSEIYGLNNSSANARINTTNLDWVDINPKAENRLWQYVYENGLTSVDTESKKNKFFDYKVIMSDTNSYGNNIEPKGFYLWEKDPKINNKQNLVSYNDYMFKIFLQTNVSGIHVLEDFWRDMVLTNKNNDDHNPNKIKK